MGLGWAEAGEGASFIGLQPADAAAPAEAEGDGTGGEGIEEESMPGKTRRWTVEKMELNPR